MQISNILSIIEIAVIFISAIFTAFVYFKNKSDKEKSRAVMIYSQIKEIENNVKYIKNKCYKNNVIFSSEFYKSPIIYNQNLWEENKIYLINLLSIDSYNEIEKFYIIANNLLNEQIEQKNNFSSLIKIKRNIYYEKQTSICMDIMKDSLEGKNSDIHNSKEQVDNFIKQVKIAYGEGSNVPIDLYIPNIGNEVIQDSLNEYRELSDGNAIQELKKIAKIRRK